MRAALLPLALAAALASACGAQDGGAEEFEGAEREVAQTVEALQEAGQEGEERQVCRRILARAVVERLRESGASCEQVVGRALDQADTYRLDVQSIRISGETAVARVQVGSGDEDVERLRLVREDGSWKIAELGG